MVMPGFVLAGGASRRMGRDKARLLLGGTPLSVRTAAVLVAGGCDPVHLVSKDASLADLGLPLIQDTEHAHHPLYGIAAALEATRSPLALFAPCDLIRLDPETVAQMMDHGQPCVASSSEGDHPLLVVLPTDLAAQARALAQQGASAHTLVEGLCRLVVSPEVLYDANRPTDLDEPA